MQCNANAEYVFLNIARQIPKQVAWCNIWLVNRIIKRTWLVNARLINTSDSGTQIWTSIIKDVVSIVRTRYYL
jgi:hypothetical protein